MGCKAVFRMQKQKKMANLNEKNQSPATVALTFLRI